MTVVIKVPRPLVLPGIAVKVATSCGNMYIHLSWYHDRLFEVFASLGKTGGCAASQSEALMRSVTLGLRCGIPVDEFIDQLQNIRCPSPHMFPKSEQALSCPDAIARTLERYGKLSLSDAIALSGNGSVGVPPVPPVTETGKAEETDEEERARVMQEMEQRKSEREKLEEEIA